MLEAAASQPVLDGAFAQRVGERRTFELPASVWQIMTACYAVFLIALLASTGGERADFAIAVSAIYLTMFFGTARMITLQCPQQDPAPRAIPEPICKPHSARCRAARCSVRS